LLLSVLPASAQPLDVVARSKAVLAQLDGEMPLAGLQESVEVLRDRWGIPHIYAKNTDDLFFAQGFVVAQDRLFQIDLWRRIAVGETAEIAGAKGVEADRFARLLKYRGDMAAEWASYSPDTKQIATAFARGINRQAARRVRHPGREAGEVAAGRHSRPDGRRRHDAQLPQRGRPR